MRVPRVMGGGGSRFRKEGGGWWQSRAGENAVCKAGGEFKRSCAERMASPRATLPRFFSLGLVLARTRATTSLDATSRAPTRRYHQRGKEKHTEGATDTETDSEAKREGSSGRRRRGKATRTESSADKDGESDRSLAPSHVSSPVLSRLSPRGTRARSETTFSCQQNSRCGPYDLRRTVCPPGRGTRATILSANAYNIPRKRGNLSARRTTATKQPRLGALHSIALTAATFSTRIRVKWLLSPLRRARAYWLASLRLGLHTDRRAIAATRVCGCTRTSGAHTRMYTFATERHTRATIPTATVHVYRTRGLVYTRVLPHVASCTHTRDRFAPANHARTCLRAEQLSGKERASFLPFANFASRAFRSFFDHSVRVVPLPRSAEFDWMRGEFRRIDPIDRKRRGSSSARCHLARKFPSFRRD